MSKQDVTKHPRWDSALCGVCGKPYKLEDLKQKAERLGLNYPAESPRFYFACCYEPTIEDDDKYEEIVGLLRRYYGM